MNLFTAAAFTWGPAYPSENVLSCFCVYLPYLRGISYPACSSETFVSTQPWASMCRVILLLGWWSSIYSSGESGFPNPCLWEIVTVTLLGNRAFAEVIKFRGGLGLGGPYLQ